MSDQGNPARPVYTVKRGGAGFVLHGPDGRRVIWQATAREAVRHARRELAFEPTGARLEVYGPDGALFKVIEIEGGKVRPAARTLYGPTISYQERSGL